MTTSLVESLATIAYRWGFLPLYRYPFIGHTPLAIQNDVQLPFFMLSALRLLRPSNVALKVVGKVIKYVICYAIEVEYGHAIILADVDNY